MKKKTKKVPVLTSKEIGQIITSAALTWSVIGSDAVAIGVDDISGAIEMVLDAGRIVDTGKLSMPVYKKLMQMAIEKQDALMEKYRGQWY